jgi:hypothetical protein
MIRRNPRLSLPDQKELHFWDWNRRKGLGWYSKQFTPSPSLSTGGGPMGMLNSLPSNNANMSNGVGVKLASVI